VLVLVVPLLPGGRSPFCLKQIVKQFNEKYDKQHLGSVVQISSPSNFTLTKYNALGKRKK